MSQIESHSYVHFDNDYNLFMLLRLMSIIFFSQMCSLFRLLLAISFFFKIRGRFFFHIFHILAFWKVSHIVSHSVVTVFKYAKSDWCVLFEGSGLKSFCFHITLITILESKSVFETMQ